MDDKEKEYEAIEKEQDASIDVSGTSDEDVLKNPQKELSMGVETEEFDILPDLKVSEELEEELQGKEGIDVTYSFRGEDVREGLKIFQKETIYKRNLIYTLLLLVVFSIYLVNIIQNPSEAFSMFLAAMCVAVTAFLWYLPAKHIKKTAQAADETQLSFRMVIYDTCVRILQENGSFLLHYRADKEITKIIETANLFLICCGKERIFIIPKRCLKDGEEEALRGLFQEKMEDKFLTRIKK